MFIFSDLKSSCDQKVYSSMERILRNEHNYNDSSHKIGKRKNQDVFDPIGEVSPKKNRPDAGNPRQDRYPLQNGNNCPPVFINGQFIKIKNTCAFDSTIEVFSNVFRNCQMFANYVLANKSTDDDDFFNFLSIYCEEGPSGRVYNLRAKILCRIFQERLGRGSLDCWSSIPEILREIMKKVSPSVEFSTCSFCDSQFEPIERRSHSFSMREVEKQGWQQLEACLKRSLSIDGLECDVCNYNTFMSKTVLSDCLCIDTTDIFHNYYKPEIPRSVCKLSDIPILIEAQSKTFILFGAIRFTFNHFIAVVRSPETNTWIQKDGLSKEIQDSNFIMHQNMAFSMFIYMAC